MNNDYVTLTIGKQKNIALIAHDSKKELMTQFCIAYCGILSHHSLCATSTTGKLIEDATGIPIKKFLAGSQGGAQQIGSLIPAMK